MSGPSLRLEEDRRDHEPGARLAGVVSWALDQAPRTAEVRLYWQTGGKGTRDVTVVEQRSFEGPQAHDQRAFDFRLPLLPHSFAGQVLSLAWGVEVVLQPGNLTCEQAIVVAPGGQAIALVGVG